MHEGRLAISGIFGRPFQESETIDLFTSLKEVLDPHQKKRLEKAISDDFKVYPISTGLYGIFTSREIENKSKSQKADYRVSMQEPKSCECHDFAYNCLNNPNTYCKHGWRIKILIQNNILPPKDIHPLLWLEEEIQNEKQNTKSPELLRKLNLLLSEVKTSKISTANLHDLYGKWALLKRLIEISNSAKKT